MIGIVISAIIGTSRIEKGRGLPSSEATSRGLGSISGVGEKQRRMTAQQTSPTPNHTRAMIIQAFTVSKQSGHRPWPSRSLHMDDYVARLHLQYVIAHATPQMKETAPHATACFSTERIAATNPPMPPRTDNAHQNVQ